MIPGLFLCPQPTGCHYSEIRQSYFVNRQLPDEGEFALEEGGLDGGGFGAGSALSSSASAASSS